MTDTPADLKYIETHQWVRLEADGTARVGITDFAQESLGDVVFVELPEVGDTVNAGEEAGVVESVKSASDVFSPVSGEVIAINEALEEEPEKINESPYDDGWLFVVKLSEDGLPEDLMDANAYAAVVEEEG
ncbi:glycine cleavage system protein GcvH [Marinobacteraceae bacterium S3BR75-40.1]